MITVNQQEKWKSKIISGKGNKYYPKELVDHLKLSVPDCVSCKKNLADQIAINFNILSHGGRYDKSGR